MSTKFIYSRAGKLQEKSEIVLQNIHKLEEAGAKELEVYYHSHHIGWCASLKSHSCGDAHIQLEGKEEDGPLRFQLKMHGGRGQWRNIYLSKFIDNYIKGVWEGDVMVTPEENWMWCNRKNIKEDPDLVKRCESDAYGVLYPTGGYDKPRIDSKRVPEHMRDYLEGHGIDTSKERPVLPKVLGVFYCDPADEEALVPRGIVRFRVLTFEPQEGTSNWNLLYGTGFYTGKYANMVSRHIDLDMGLEDAVYFGKTHTLTHYNAVDMFLEGPDAYFSAISKLIKEKNAKFDEDKAEKQEAKRIKEAKKAAIKAAIRAEKAAAKAAAKAAKSK